ncbi:MAG: hypothetical protein IJ106_10370 [Parasporobacterium sp.]|nr:hypothetical protein [Parasporobacterium sp.]
MKEENVIIRGIAIDISEEKLNEIFQRLYEAEKQIRECYTELQYLGVVRIIKAPTDENSEGSISEKENRREL